MGTTPRSANLTIAGQNFTVNQAPVCSTTPINYGQTINGVLTTSDCRSPIDGAGVYSDLYTFSGLAGQQVLIETTAANLSPGAADDTKIHLIGPTGTLIATDDDSGPGALSRIPATGYFALPSTGTYTIDVTTFTSNATGTYSIRLSPNPAADTDNDGMPDGVEVTEGRNLLVKDNDIFTNNRWFAMQQYRDFLGREGDVAGITGWTNILTNGTQTRAQVIQSFFTSPEFQNYGAPIVRLYFAYFQRIPDYAGQTFWTNQLRGGMSLDAISQVFATSPEFVQTYGNLTNTQFITLVYQNVLNRTPSQNEVDAWVSLLNQGAPRGQVMAGFSESPEFKQLSANKVFVVMMYVGMLRRAPEQAGFDGWVSYLVNGNSGLQLIQSFLNAQEYHNRFLP